ncbi:Orotidine 5'-phosphate decarboxylase [Candidatus Arsenophonus lipoptenae]|uniref:Orotidine 5'-phosphate decarboxylase n=1 Tax=Candidatus Arsenophonus lipoptenae TaxID=634113 RepID=A0A0X9VI77_9GAMM|nr:orotidine-5'-phosphate decarboxylase [Candidatus Arsenophonus lipoptenae]AMA64645.1 Orotidine 5'-phosphate decarboxylase [Candidatus Arsenophonus lipoptenae]
MIVNIRNTFLSSAISPIIVALDFHDLKDALSFVDNISPKLCRLKVGIHMFTLYGPKFIKILHDRGFQVFLDLKFHDIPNIVAQAVKSAAEMGVWMVNLHSSGGYKMMIAAKKALAEYGKNAPLLIAITVLTSIEQIDLHHIGINQSLNNYVLKLAQLVKKCGLDGIVCSANEALILKSICNDNDFLLVTPGIRLIGAKLDDQCRIMTPEKAINIGVDYIVIGRPITYSDNPVLTLEYINRLIGWIK